MSLRSWVTNDVIAFVGHERCHCVDEIYQSQTMSLRVWVTKDFIALMSHEP